MPKLPCILLDLSVANTNISNVRETITIKSAEELDITTTSVSDTDSFINARNLNRNLSIIIWSSNVEARRETVLVELNDTRNVNIQVVNCLFKSTGSSGVTRLVDTRSYGELTDVNIYIENSTLLTEYYNSKTMYLYSCFVHLNLTFVRSEFSSNSDLIYIYAFSATTDISHCKFSKGQKSFYFQFCNRQFEDKNYTRTISIYNNSFDVSSRNEHIYIYSYYTNPYSHAFNIHDNIFTQSNFRQGRGFKFFDVNSYSNYKGHEVLIKNNIFEGYAYALDVYGRAKSIDITENVFYNNSGVFILDQSRYYAETVNVTRNVIKYNEADGIIQLKPYTRDKDFRITVVGNAFDNNTGTVLTTTSQYITVKHNFFENPKALYNLKVIQGSSESDALNASLNYWGSTNVKTVASQIYDVSYDEALFDVTFRPYLGSRNLSDIQDEDAGFISSTGEIGGILRESITLTSEDSPYIVTFNIEITEEGSLTIKAGVTLLFKASQGISVLGKFLK